MSFWKKNSVQLLLWISLGLASIILLGTAISSQRNTNFSDLKVKIDYSNGMYFIEEAEIEGTIANMLGDSLKNTSYKDLPISNVERELEKNPFISNVEVYSNITGDLIVKVSQRTPVLRVINKHGVSFYIDENAQTMPLSANFTARVPVASGNIDFNNDALQDIQMQEMLGLVEYIRSKPFWNAQTEQIYVNKDNDYELIPKLENHVFLIGDAQDLDAKFKRMNIFYKEILKNQKSDQFKIINVKFKNQIICSKN